MNERETIYYVLAFILFISTAPVILYCMNASPFDPEEDEVLGYEGGGVLK